MARRSLDELILRVINFYPPYLGAGIRVVHRKGDAFTFHVEMALRFYNRNAFGTQFGGSLYAMCDPFYCFLLLRHLGRERFVVWDKAASIEFRRPGKGRVFARFHIPPETVEAIRLQAETGAKVEPVLETDVFDVASGEVVAHVVKTLYVRKKRDSGGATADPGAAPDPPKNRA
ncbi:MAG: YiiD C-terminal domain-containing protein [Acidobacteria bacterium]|nr:YiiD C-terminal domain-containing protein [Acidobacteriota bacterium]